MASPNDSLNTHWAKYAHMSFSFPNPYYEEPGVCFISYRKEIKHNQLGEFQLIMEFLFYNGYEQQKVLEEFLEASIQRDLVLEHEYRPWKSLGDKKEDDKIETNFKKVCDKSALAEAPRQPLIHAEAKNLVQSGFREAPRQQPWHRADAPR
ncbi:hypothetical protein HAX54_019736 [Datura stramonium]|uniref:Uncharacterized protein n=1 Tax=Datura stramonium TaxID=4076 RepID=A0ABS8URT5_DATST|nr:hypothetical protein [Datura stramonium]